MAGHSSLTARIWAQRMIKMLNKNLTEKVESLESIINKEASANTYYFNYPPKDAASGPPNENG